MIAAGLGMAFWITSASMKKRGGEGWTAAVPLILLLMYGLIFFVAV